MKFHKLSILAGCISLIISNTSWSDVDHKTGHNTENVSKLDDDNKDNNGIKALFDDAHADVQLRTVYFNQRAPKKGSAGTSDTTGKSQAWRSSAFGSQFNFYSGYAWDHVGFDWSVFNALGLAHGGNKNNLNGQFLSLKSNGKFPSNLFVPAGVAALKFKAGNDDAKINAQAGLVHLHGEFLCPASPRAITSTYRGAHVYGNIHNLNLYASVANAVRLRSERKLKNFKSNTNKKISYIAETGAYYTFNSGIGMKLVYAKGNNYLDEYLTQVTYDVEGLGDGVLKLKGKSFLVKKGGNLWNGKDTTKGKLDGFKKRATSNVLAANYVLDPWNFGVAYTKISAKGGKGLYKYKLAPNGYGSYNAATSAGNSDFNYDGENAYQASVGYTFKTMPGLSANFTYTQGTDINYKKNKNINVKNEHEFDYAIVYAFQQPAVKGLQLRGALYELHQNGANGFKNSRTHEIRVFADYKIAVF